MATARENIIDLEQDLATAVACGNIVAAQSAIEMLACYSSSWSNALLGARQVARPQSPLPRVKAMQLPMPGHLPHSTEAVPIFATER